ncbi:ERF family ssDNA binding protein [Gordonia Phage Sephiroth]|uniref:ERF family ssDNA binding protein n=1 Tax=Gordonia Phage Sephiroth TaxID=2767553 RepID=A0A7G9UZE6_9CAUD|nr:Erf-like ssDNA annealing protein [Gordonia Phage Sephiroth]QNN99401.1 ERF family ssDNA binding protein [Gordonia Phage Sephiroth]
MTDVQSRLRAVQGALKAPKGQYNSFAKYHYRSAEDILEAAKPLCVEHGLVLTVSDEVRLLADDGAARFYVVATAKVTADDGSFIQATGFAREGDDKKGMDPAQLTGATSSYARKYALNGLFAIDDSKDADTDEHATQTGQEPKGGKTSGGAKRPAANKSAAAKPDAKLTGLRAKAKKALSENEVPVDEFRKHLATLSPLWAGVDEVDDPAALEGIIEWANQK